MTTFKDYERATTGETRPLSQALDELKVNTEGLIPAIAQQHDTGEVLMMAWMNKAAIEDTLQTRRVCYWSRSRQSYWRKGESSGQIQELIEMRFDCDGDSILLKVNQKGAACHTGRRDCFFHQVVGDHVKIDSEPMIDPEKLYGK